METFQESTTAMQERLLRVALFPVHSLGATLGLSLVAEAGLGGIVAVGAATNVVGGAMARELDSSPSTRAGDAKEIVFDLATGAAGGVVGAKIEGVVKSQLPNIEKQVAASLPKARQGDYGASRAVRGHMAKAASVQRNAEILGTVAGAKASNTAAPIARSGVQKSIQNRKKREEEEIERTRHSSAGISYS